MDTKLVVQNLDSAMKPGDLESLFGAVGEVTSARVETIEGATGLRYVGYVQLSNEQEAADCIERFNGQLKNGARLVVRLDKPHVPDPNYKFDKRLNASPRKSF